MKFRKNGGSSRSKPLTAAHNSSLRSVAMTMGRPRCLLTLEFFLIFWFGTPWPWFKAASRGAKHFIFIFFNSFFLFFLSLSLCFFLFCSLFSLFCFSLFPPFFRIITKQIKAKKNGLVLLPRSTHLGSRA